MAPAMAVALAAAAALAALSASAWTRPGRRCSSGLAASAGAPPSHRAAPVTGLTGGFHTTGPVGSGAGGGSWVWVNGTGSAGGS